MEFCDKCGGSLMPKKAGSKNVLECRRCGKRKSLKSRGAFKMTVPTNKTASEVIVVDKKSSIEILPKTIAQCPKCEHNEAFWWMQQTRAADEPATRFYKCSKCSHVWREYE
ncbi:MAG TPA: transcription factor S [archaeon]|nr:transcription factor S [archaeon]